MIVSPRALVAGYPWLDTLTHEYTHYVVTRISHNTVPIWLHEGIAKFEERRWRGPSGGGLTPAMEHLLATGIAHKQLITFERDAPVDGEAAVAGGHGAGVRRGLHRRRVTCTRRSAGPACARSSSASPRASRSTPSDARWPSSRTIGAAGCAARSCACTRACCRRRRSCASKRARARRPRRARTTRRASAKSGRASSRAWAACCARAIGCRRRRSSTRRRRPSSARAIRRWPTSWRVRISSSAT